MKWLSRVAFILGMALGFIIPEIVSAKIGELQCFMSIVVVVAVVSLWLQWDYFKKYGQPKLIFLLSLCPMLIAIPLYNNSDATIHPFYIIWGILELWFLNWDKIQRYLGKEVD